LNTSLLLVEGEAAGTSALAAVLEVSGPARYQFLPVPLIPLRLEAAELLAPLLAQHLAGGMAAIPFFRLSPQPEEVVVEAQTILQARTEALAAGAH
jgi:hypothetical protein